MSWEGLLAFGPVAVGTLLLLSCIVFVAISRTVVNVDGESVTAPDPVCLSASGLVQVTLFFLFVTLLGCVALLVIGLAVGSLGTGWTWLAG